MAFESGQRSIRIVTAGDLPVVVRILHHTETVIAIPVRLPRTEVLSLASVVLSSDEFAELSERLPATGERPPPGGERLAPAGEPGRFSARPAP